MSDARAELLALADDPSDRAVLERYLNHAGTREELLSGLCDRVSLGAKPGIVRAFRFFGDPGLAALCELVRRGCFSPAQAAPTIDRFPKTPCALGILLECLPYDSDHQASRLVTRWAVELFPADLAKSSLLRELRSETRRIRVNAMRGLVDLLRRAPLDSVNAVGEFFLDEALPVVEIDTEADVQCELMKAYATFADGRFLPRIKGAMNSSRAALKLRLCATLWYLVLFQIQGPSAFWELPEAPTILDLWAEGLRELNVFSRRELFAWILGFGLHDLPLVKEWIALAQTGEYPEIAHELEDAEWDGTAGVDPWHFAWRELGRRENSPGDDEDEPSPGGEGSQA